MIGTVLLKANVVSFYPIGKVPKNLQKTNIEKESITVS